MPFNRSRALAGLLLVALGGCTTTPSSAAPTQGATIQPFSRAPATPRASATALWPAPADAMELAVEAGLVPETVENLEYHVHAHLDIFVDGQPVLVPAGIGINIVDPGVHVFTEDDGSLSYGGIQAPCATPCISPLHTHWEVGVIHTESATPTPNTLGQLFIEWDVPLSQTCVGEHCSPEEIAYYVDGEPYTGEPAAIELAEMREIAIVIGTPPPEIPSTADFSLP
jgi:hypothetical protein